MLWPFRCIFRAVTVSILPGASTNFLGANGIIYAMRGSTEILMEGGVKTLGVGEGLLIPGGKQVSLNAAGGEVSTLLHFLLVPATDLNQSAEAIPAVVTETTARRHRYPT
jgi:hypothetical protein